MSTSIVEPNIRYVAPNGNDNNDGKSSSYPMETVLRAYDSLTLEEGGVIYVSHNSKIGSDHSQGIWIIGEQDPFWWEREGNVYLRPHMYSRLPPNGDIGDPNNAFDRQGNKITEGIIIYPDGRITRRNGTNVMPNDPIINDSRVPVFFTQLAGWRKAKNVIFKGIGSGKVSAYGLPPAAQLGQIGNQRPGHTPIVFAPYILDKMKPAIWVAGAKQIAFEDLVIRNRSQAIKLGVSATGLPYRGQVGSSTTRYVEGDTPSGYVSFKNIQVDVHGSSANQLPSEQFVAISQQVLRDNPSWAPDDNRLNIEIERRIHSMVGPGVLIEWAFKIWFDHCDFTASEAGINSDDRAAILIDGRRPGIKPGLIRIHNCRFKNGNVKYYTSGSGGSLYVRDCLFEGIFNEAGVPLPMPVPVHILNASLNDSILLENLGASDAKVEADVKIEGRYAVPDSVVCINIGTVIGPATIINTSNSSVWQNKKETLAGSRQVGFWQGRVAAQHDSARRAFSPVAVRFRNLMPQDPQDIIRLAQRASDPAAANPELIPNVLAPDGTSEAFRLWATSNLIPPSYSPLQSKNIICSTLRYQDVNQDDILIAGVWVRAVTNDGFMPAPTAMISVGFSDSRYQFTDTGVHKLSINAPLKGGGEWEWLSIADKVWKAYEQDTNLEMTFFSQYNDDHFPDVNQRNKRYSHDFYAPILLYIPREEGITDNEIYELRQHLSTWPYNIEPGTVALLRGQDFALQSHVISDGRPPEQWPTSYAMVSGNDISGRVNIYPTSEKPVRDALGIVIFSKPYKSRPHVILTAATQSAADINVFVEPFTGDTPETKNLYTGFSIKATNATLANLSSPCEWSYFVIQ